MAAPNGQNGSGIIAGINVTPLVDVLLPLLLVIFIVTAKIIVTPAVPLDLPHAAHGEEVQVRPVDHHARARAHPGRRSAHPERRRPRGQGSRRSRRHFPSCAP